MRVFAFIAALLLAASPATAAGLTVVASFSILGDMVQRVGAQDDSQRIAGKARIGEDVVDGIATGQGILRIHLLRQPARAFRRGQAEMAAGPTDRAS